MSSSVCPSLTDFNESDGAETKNRALRQWPSYYARRIRPLSVCAGSFGDEVKAGGTRPGSPEDWTRSGRSLQSLEIAVTAAGNADNKPDLALSDSSPTFASQLASGVAGSRAQRTWYCVSMAFSSSAGHDQRVIR